MSSILKALRKLEDEYPRHAGGNANWPRIPGVKKSLRRWEINSGRFAPVLWAALTVVVLAAAAWFLIYMRSPDELPAPSAELPEAPQPTPVAQRQQSGPVVESEAAARRPTDRRPAGKRRRRVVETGTQSRPVSTAAARTPKDQRKRRSAAPLPVKQAEPQTGSQLPVLQTGLELQAISWASNPANRIAVINGNIVREGGTIEGYFVVRIEEDEIMVRKGLSQWRLVFKLKK